MMPVLIVNLDGVMGYWNTIGKHKHFVLRPKIINSLITLSYDFRLVAVSSMSQKLISRLIYGLINTPPNNDYTEENDSKAIRHLFFDAVYQLNC
jgi:hypothetical protein